MKERELKEYATKLGIIFTDQRVSSTGWLQAHCPLAPWTHTSGRDRTPSFGLHVNARGYSAYKCFTCGSHGSLPGLVFRIANYSDPSGVREADPNNLRNLAREIERAEIAGEPEHIPEWDDFYQEEEERKVEWPNPATAFQRYPFAYGEAGASQYLRQRNISLSTAFKCGLRWDAEERRVLFPVRTVGGRLAGFTGRACDKHTRPKVRDYAGLEKRKYLLGANNLSISRRRFRDYSGSPRKYTGKLIAVEGPFDYARCRQHGFPFVVALLGSELTAEKLALFEELALPVVWFTDDDAAGQKCLYGSPEHPGSGALRRLYRSVTQYTVKYPAKKRWVNGELRTPSDPDELTRKEAWSMYENAELYVG